MKKVFILIVSVLILGLLFTGCEDIANITSPATVDTGGDLSRCICVQSDSATGWGTPILPKGNWFMYNEYEVGGSLYPDGYYVYQIQAGNPKDGLNLNFIAKYGILSLPGNLYIAKLWIDPSFVVVDEHLAISDYRDFTAKPGRDDNQDFGIPFFDDDGEFFIFVHLAVECK